MERRASKIMFPRRLAELLQLPQGSVGLALDFSEVLGGSKVDGEELVLIEDAIHELHAVLHEPVLRIHLLFFPARRVQGGPTATSLNGKAEVQIHPND